MLIRLLIAIFIMGVGYAAGGHYGEYWVVNFGAKRSQRNAVIA